MPESTVLLLLSQSSLRDTVSSALEGAGFGLRVADDPEGLAPAGPSPTLIVVDGAWPDAAPGYYGFDEDAVIRYGSQARSDEGFVFTRTIDTIESHLRNGNRLGSWSLRGRRQRLFLRWGSRFNRPLLLKSVISGTANPVASW